MLLAACRTAPLVDPPPVSAAPTSELTHRAILRALIHESFVVDQDVPGRIRAQCRDGWIMTVDIEYSDRVTLRYVDSELLDYRVRHGVRYIHKGYNVRAQRLVDAIQREERLIMAEVDPDSIPEPPVGAPPPPNPDR